MIYIFDKTQAIIKVLTNDDFTAAHLNFKINTATTFEFSLPASKALPSDSKYVATPHPLDDSKFIMLRLTERFDNTETIDYSAYELAYQELATDGYIEDKRPQNQSALNLMKIALDGTNWELNNVNVSGAATTNFYYVDHLSAISNVVDLLGGEIVFYIEIQGNTISGRYMDYLARQGADTSKVFAKGSNLLTIERQSDTSNIYTAILPRGKGEEIDNGDANTPDGYGRRINIADVEWKKSSGKPLDKPKGSIVLSDPDATAEWGQINGNARLLLQTYDDIDDVNVLINSAYKTLQSVNHTQIQYSTTVADVGGLSLGDTVLIMHGDRDLSYKTRVFEVKYDLLAPDQTELSLGDDLSSNSITSQINNLNAVADTTSSQTQWTINQIGRPSTTFGNTEPANPKVGDVFFKELPDGGTEIYRWNGDIWELLASPTTADDIADAVTDAVTQAKAHTDEVKQGLSTDIDTAKSQATSQASSALASAKSAATSQFTQAQSALSAAKTDLTNSIASEASARNQAVAAANSQAQTYANQAKADALNAVNKEVADRQSAVSALDTKATNAVNQAKSDITDTINALSVGGRNLLLDTSISHTGIGSNSINDLFNAQGAIWRLAGNKKVSDLYNQYGSSGYLTISFDWIASGSTISGTFVPQWESAPWDKGLPTIYPSITNTSGHYECSVKLSTDGYSTSTATYFRFRQDNLQCNITINNLKIESGNKATDWTPAPEDVVLDYTTKDNQIKETITQYKDTNDGKVSQAQTDATTALGLVATKVSQTDYDQKTGDLSTKINDVKQTADSSAQTIADIKTADGKQDARMSEIENTASGLKSTVSDISTAQGKQSGYISELQHRADGFDATVTKVNNLSVGGRNLFLNSRGLSNAYDQNGGVTVTLEPFDSTTNMWHIVAPQNSGGGIGIYLFNYALNKIATNSHWSYSADIKGTGKPTKFGIELGNKNSIVGNIGSDWSRISQTGYIDNNTKTIAMYFDTTDSPLDVYIKLPKLEAGNVPTDWTLAPEDIDSATAKAQLTADTAALNVSKYQKDADGRISKAQAGVEANANAITQKVSQTDYDKKTGDLTTAVSKAQTTADSVVMTVGNYQTSNDERVKAAESAISQNANDITLKVAKTDYDNNNSQLNTRFTKVETTANGTATTVSDLKQTVNNLGQVNQLFNTEFSPDFAGWYTQCPNPQPSNTVTTELTKIGTDGFGSNAVSHKDNGVWINSAPIEIKSGTPVSISARVSVPKPVSVGIPLALYVMAFDSNGTRVLSQGYNIPVDQLTSTPTTIKYENIIMPSGATKVYYILGWNVPDEVYISQPMLVFSDHVGTYVQGNYNNNAALAQVKITADSISNFVRDSNGNISSDFQTALSKTSIITGSTLATSIQTQTSSQITSALTDNNGKIISLINQDTSGVQIAGENIVLNGDTTVTGAFKVSQANIANGAIGTAQIGDAAITSAKIANLDVSKITGDVTNFVKSGWNNAYGSNVTIDGAGMVVSYGNTSTSFNNGNVLFKQLADYADGSNQVETIGSISTTHNGTVNNIVIGLFDQTHIPFGSTDGKRIGSPTGEIYGGDLIAFGKARDFNGNFDHIFSYSNQTASLKYGITEGFNFRDKINFNSNEIVSGSVNYNLKIGALKFSGKFDGKYVPVIVATWSGYIGGGIAFGGDNVVAFNQTQATIIS